MNRYYSTGYGRFLTVDPFGGSGHVRVPGSLNRYSYSAGDPVNRVDPSGRVACDSEEDDDEDVDLVCYYDDDGNPGGPDPGDQGVRGGAGGATGVSDLIKQSRARVINKMTDKCAQAIGAKSAEQADGRLEGIKIGTSDTGEFSVDTDPSGAVTSAPLGQYVAEYTSGPFGIFRKITFNLAVNWSDPSQTAAVNQNGNQVVYNMLAGEAYELNVPSVSASQFMDLTLLHELAHSFGVNHPGDNSEAEDSNIWKSCFQ
jgi:uncharacterized protein RhaS with RHS repeats